MGEIYSFKCSNCSLNAEVSGGADCGMISETETVFCKKCEKLIDIETGTHESSNPEKIDPKCPNCYGEDFIVWKNGDPCPICGSPLIKGDLLMHWD
jgi:hypothetical protein